MGVPWFYYGMGTWDALKQSQFTPFNDWDTGYEECYTLDYIINALGLNIGLMEYPLFDENYRVHLNNAIVDHFRYRRIAAESAQMFIFFLNRKMAEIMPTYNAIYKKLQDVEDPFRTSEYQNTSTNKIDGESTTKTTSTDKAESLATASTMPQSYVADITAPEHLDNASQSETRNNGTVEGTATSGQTGTGTSQGWGRNGDLFAQFTSAYVTNWLNVDQQIFRDLEPLFMQLWDNMAT